MTSLGEEIEEASRGRIVPHDATERDKDAMRKDKAKETAKRFDKVNSERDTVSDSGEEKAEGKDYARGSGHETVSDVVTPH